MSWRTLALMTVGVLLAALVTPAAPTAAAAAPTLQLTLAAPDFRASEAVFINGYAAAGTSPLGRAEIVIDARTGAGAWETVRVVRTASSGRFRIIERPRADTAYRARLVTDAVTSAAVLARRTGKARSLAERRTALAFTTGAARSGEVGVRRFGKRLTVQRFAKAWLVEVGASTSIVHGRMLKKYRKRGGVDGRLGAPVADMTCRLMEGACVQRFQNGAIYLNKHARRKVSVAYGHSRATPTIAAALSQRGYVEPYYRGSKYGTWQDSTDAWCAMFLSWASHASGSGNAIPQADHFPQMLATVRGQGRLRNRPKVGRLAFLGPGPPTHVALVVAVRNGQIRTIEGNVDRFGGPGKPRGVRSLWRNERSVLFYASPSY